MKKITRTIKKDVVEVTPAMNEPPEMPEPIVDK